MFEMPVLMVFSVAALALAATPGPDMMLVAARSAAQGRLAGLLTYLGVSAGSFGHALMMALGLSQLFAVVPLAYDAVRLAGAAYLLFLAWQCFTRHRRLAMQPGPARPLSVWVMFRQGFLSNILNPKVALFYLALFPQFVVPEAGSVGLQILVLALILNVIALVVNGGVILIASRAGAYFAGRSKYRRTGDWLLGAVFAGLAARLAFDGQR
ncbi:LysE family translocator [Algicella marina]|uniref:LysE family translocator n=1 Tax=Algicella marina TaxID=2683284 RepID=A0A6P1T3L3_9RHOB|nr:LysE family translocator [Algicella marina]QHQ36351.1 LysE family translocator [Algicella marina]